MLRSPQKRSGKDYKNRDLKRKELRSGGGKSQAKGKGNPCMASLERGLRQAGTELGLERTTIVALTWARRKKIVGEERKKTSGGA